MFGLSRSALDCLVDHLCDLQNALLSHCDDTYLCTPLDGCYGHTCKYLRINCMKPNNFAICETFCFRCVAYIKRRCNAKNDGIESIYKIPCQSKRPFEHERDRQTEREDECVLRCSKVGDSIKLMACKMIRVNSSGVTQCAAHIHIHTQRQQLNELK